MDVHASAVDGRPAGALPAIAGAPRAFPSPAGRLAEVAFALDRREGKIPSPVQRPRQSVRETAHGEPAQSVPRGLHSVARRPVQLQTACRQGLLLVKCPESRDWKDKVVGLAARCRKVESVARGSRLPSRWKMVRWVWQAHQFRAMQASLPVAWKQKS